MSETRYRTPKRNLGHDFGVFAVGVIVNFIPFCFEMASSPVRVAIYLASPRLYRYSWHYLEWIGFILFCCDVGGVAAIIWSFHFKSFGLWWPVAGTLVAFFFTTVVAYYCERSEDD